MTDPQWYIRRAETESGPVSVDELLRQLGADEITLATRVRAADSDHWVTLSSVESLRPRVLAALRARSRGLPEPREPARMRPFEMPIFPTEAEASDLDEEPMIAAAALGRRLAAGAIDLGFVVSATSACLLLPMLAPDPDNLPGALASIAGLAFVIGWLWFVLQSIGPARATLGQMVFDLEVRDLHGEPVTLARASLHYALALASLLLLGAGFAPARRDRWGRTWHDRYARCVVIDTREPVGA
jgi:uncharacterized RDD family membrane protein YckC